MWGSVLMLALVTAADPVRLGVTLLMISRPRPILNLLAYWVGCVIASIPPFLVPLIVLHFSPMFTLAAQHIAISATAASSTIQHVRIGMGILALSIAVLMTVRFSARHRAHLPIPRGDPSTPVLQPSTPISRLLARGQNTSEGGSAIRRLLGRARNAWESGSLWVAVVVGIVSGPPPVEYLFVITAIVASGAALGTQVSAGLAFIVGMLAVVEIMLVSYLATPAKTQAVILQLHDWVRAHRARLFAGIFAVLGASLVASGI
jgi:hypothetical protein